MNDRLKVLNESPPPRRWYEEGLRFQCTECGQCCTGSPGYTWVSEEEIITMAAKLNLELEEFGRRYLRQIGQKFALLERPDTYDCVFLEGQRCKVYDVRPTQCRTFPYWPSVLESRDAWRTTGTYCEGIDHPEAPLIELSEIEQQRRLQESAETE